VKTWRKSGKKKTPEKKVKKKSGKKKSGNAHLSAVYLFILFTIHFIIRSYFQRALEK